MTVLNERQAVIVRRLLDGECLSVSRLAASFETSERTIRGDLTTVQDVLTRYGLGLSEAAGQGLGVVATAAQRKALLSSPEMNEMASGQRVPFLAARMLLLGTSTYDQLAELCGTSRQTVIRDFPGVERLLGELDVEVDREKGKGLAVRAAEATIRQAFVKMLNSSSLGMAACERLACGLESYDAKARELIDEVSETLDVHFSNVRLLELQLGFCIMRCVQGHSLSLEPIPQDVLDVTRDANFGLYVTALSGYEADMSDKLCLIWTLLGAEKVNPGTRISSSVAAADAADYLLERLNLAHGAGSMDYERISRGLRAHLDVALYRIKNHIPIENKMLDQIKLCIPLVFDFTNRQMNAYGRLHGIEFDENECAYIAMYVASIFESSMGIEGKVKVLLACSFGTTTSAILSSRMRQFVPECEFVGPLSHDEAERYLDANGVDLVISTNDSIVGDVQTIRVSPLLQSRDISLIKSVLFQLTYTKMCRNFLARHMGMGCDRRVTLGDFISADDVQIASSSSGWEAAIGKAARPLVSRGSLEQRYVQRMVRAVKEYGTYMVMTPGTAYVHAGTNDGINEDCTALLHLRSPVIFGDENAKPVRDVVVIGVKSSESKALISIAKILSKETNRRRLEESDVDVDEILALC